MVRPHALHTALPVALLSMLLLHPDRVCAQAWVPPAGAGSVSVAAQRIDNTGHLLDDGTLLPLGKSTDASLYVEGEFAVSDRLTLSAGMPFVMARYVGPEATPLNFLPVDSCYCWHAGWQDLGFRARYNLLKRGVSLTPSVAIGVPSHDYNYRGEATIGRHLKEVRLGADVGRQLEFLSPRISVQAGYSYAFVERKLEIPNNRSNVGVEVGFAATRRLSARWVSSWQRTHGGLRFPQEVEHDQDRIEQHDRLLRDNYWHTGVGGSFSFPAIDVFASYLMYARGTNSHAGRVVTAGISWPFEFVHGGP